MTHPDSIHITTAGISALTDLGRTGKAHLGVQTNGAADQQAARTANVLVGNDQDAPLVEITAFMPFTFTTERRMLIAVTGAATHVRVDDITMPSHTPVVTWPGAAVTVPRATTGLRTYLAVHGAIVADTFLDSTAFDPLIGVGTQLHDGDTVAVTGAAVRTTPDMSYFPIHAQRPELGREYEIGILPGPEAHEFPDFAPEHREALSVGTNSDHVGLRLEGRTFTRTTATEILSRGVPMGAIEIPPSGGMIALLRGRPLTAGYPIPAIVGRGWHDTLGQLRPGDQVRLKPTTPARSIAKAVQRADALVHLAARCTNAFAASHVF